MKPIDRVVFFGTPQFAIPTLVALAESRYRPAWVVTQPRRGGLLSNSTGTQPNRRSMTGDH